MQTESRLKSNEICQLIAAYQKSPDDEVLQIKLIDHYENLVDSLSGKFAVNREAREDLFQVGMIGLISALKRYDHSYGHSFESFAVPTIIGEIKRYIRDKTWSVHVPRRIKELAPKIRRASEELTASLQRSPSIDEIAEVVGESEESVLETLEMVRSYRALSVDSQIDADSDRGALTLLDTFGFHDQGYEQVHEKMLLESGFKKLSKREKEVLLFTYFDNLSQKEAGERLGISQMHASRIQRKALQKLREALPADDEEPG